MAEGLTASPRGHSANQGIGGSEQFYSVEFSIDGIDLAYQFKLWTLASSSMFVVVKEDSILAQRLRVGDVVNMKYYTNGYAAPIECLNTAIRHITKDEQGPFRGHYVVGLEIVDQQGPLQRH